MKKLCLISNQLIHDNIIITIYGEKDEKFNGSYILEFNKLLENSSIIYKNFVDPLKMESIYSNTNILLIPSRYETGSFTCVEAYSYGIPVIARNVYGLKYLIQNKITGYLCDTDEEILEILKNIRTDIIIENKTLILEESLKYNIIEKVSDFENIIENALFDKKNNIKNAIFITSVINCINEPLSYYHIRSIFSTEERYKHTLETVNSLRAHIPNLDIYFLECSNLSDYPEIESNIKKNVDCYYNFYNNQKIKDSVNSNIKGLGEANLLIEGINKLKISYNNIFKISGRYYLNNDFNYNIFQEKYNYFTNWDNSSSSYASIFYKINGTDITLFKNALNNSVDSLNNNESIEICLHKYFKKNIKLIEKMNVSGYLATEGYLFSI